MLAPRGVDQPGQLCQPHRGAAPEHGREPIVTVVARQLVQRIEPGQVGLARAVLVDALAPGDPNGRVAPRSRREAIDQRGLADAGLAAEQKQAPLAALYPPERSLEDGELAMAADEEPIMRARRE